MPSLPPVLVLIVMEPPEDSIVIIFAAGTRKSLPPYVMVPEPDALEKVNVFVSSVAHAVCAIVSIAARVRMRLNVRFMASKII